MEPTPNTLADQAYAAVREDILRGRLRPGAALSRRRIAEELGMSLLPVAEALRRLEDDRLVESPPPPGPPGASPPPANGNQPSEFAKPPEPTSRRAFAHRRT